MKTVTAHLTHIVGTYARTAVLGAAVLTTAFIAPAAAHAQVYASVNVAPPAIPEYDQPQAPGEGYIWTPGYWAYGDQGYYWIDGAWVEAPYDGALWTPGYWGYDDGAYEWNAGYWGDTVGYYGGIDYGFGYFGAGFYGGYWNRGHFFYNTAYNHIDGRRFHNIYDDRSHGNGFFNHPGSRSFDPHPHVDEHRQANFRGNDFHGNDGFNRGGFNQQQNRTNFEQANRGGFNQQQDRGNFNQQGNRPVYQGSQGQQRNFAAPQTQPAQGFNQNQGRGFSQAPAQQQQQRFSQPEQHFSQPVQQGRPAQVNNAPQQQHFSAPAGGGGGFHGGGGGGGFHGGGGGRR